jgi:hypothetical protein
MSEDPHPPGEGAGQLPPNGGNGGPNGPPPPTFVSVRFTTPPATQMFIGVPFTIQVAAVSGPPGNVTSVSVSFDGRTLTVASDGGNNWHAVVTPTTAGAHTFAAEASSTSLRKSATADLQLTAVPVLSGTSPTPASGIITTATLSFNAGVAVATSAFAVGAGGWQYQLAGGPWVQPTAVSQPSASTWQLTLTLPAAAVEPGGTSYPLLIRATTPQNLTATLALTVHAVDQTPPGVSPDIPAEAVAGTTPVVTVQVTDRVPGAVFSSVAANGVSLRFDGQPCPVTQTAAGDPGTWSATLPPITHAVHSVTIDAVDAVGNTASKTVSITVALTSWTRLEPVPRDPTLMEGLQARVADPFWLLARQAAFGEFGGQDASSPVSFRLNATASRLTRLRPSRAPGTAMPATGPGELLPPGGGPLEMLAEAEAEPGKGGAARPLFAAQAGLHYRRLLARAAGAGDLSTYERGLLAAYPVPAPTPAVPPPPVPGIPPPPGEGDAMLAPYASQVPDGARLYADLVAALRPAGGGPGALPASPPLDGANAAVVTSVARAWLVWYEAVSGQELGQRDTWIPERSEYAFSVAAPGPAAETVLAAAELDTGELDWLDFDLLASQDVAPGSSSVSLGAVPADLPGGDTSIAITGLPVPVTFRGMPNRCWWDFEDASIDFGAITAPAESLTTSVIVEYAMCYGNDHFIVPVPLDIGSVLRVDSLTVTNTFGEVLVIGPVAEVDSAAGPFRLFEHANPTQAAATPVRDPLFVLFPTAGDVMYGPAVEEVHFVRDEAAELVWAIEQTSLGAVGLPVDRTADALAHFMPFTPTSNDGAAPPTRTYHLRTDVEANWFPFLLIYPAPEAGAPPPPPSQLAMADVPPLTTSQATPVPWGRILAPFAPTGPAQPGVLLPIEEVTRAGAQVTRAWRYARWIDGRHLSWVGRRVRPGRGSGASGLTFDLAI